MIYAQAPIRRAILVLAIIIIAAFIVVSPWVGAGEAAGISPAIDGEEPPRIGFPANPGSLGAIPDGGAGCDPSPGAPLDVTFTVSGVSAAPTSVSVSATLSHTFVGDVSATLIAPNSTSLVVFARTGATTANGTGDSSNVGGTYFFADTATASPSGGWWQEASSLNSTGVMTPGTYRSTAAGGAGQVNPAPPTSLNTAFSGVSPEGTWTLRFTDGCQQDTGSVTAALLTLNGTGSKHVVDMNGDGRTDWSVARGIGGGPPEQRAWFTKFNGVAGTQVDVFGLASDLVTPADFDGDKKTDVAVWRPDPVAAFFYVMRSQTSTFQAIQWGITGDDPTVVGDYDGDGRADAAVYRAGASAGQQSFWHILKSSNGGYLPIQWGQNGDFLAPGDYDGDYRQDAAIQRDAGGGSAIFFIRFANGTFSQTVFGTPTDFIVPGDYDGDGRTDIATVRGIAGQINWFYDPSSIPGTQVVQTLFGVSGDALTPGDYDGDGRTDQAVWRQNPTPGQSAFFVNGSSGGFFAFPWGAWNDYPVAGYVY
ncbi:MAG: proprotein convertase P-domain-containing protein [Pyrinomonadaceae bacterium]|nr:proprotein convertase P-domain-containing protein [Pyrinomonadaceae bacterium]